MKVESFKTSDGKLFESKEEAGYHEKTIKFKKAYYNRGNLFNVESETVIVWMIKNKKAILDFLS